MIRAILAAVFLFALPLTAKAQSSVNVAELSRTSVNGTVEEARKAVAALAERGNPDAVASLILALRYRDGDLGLTQAIAKLTGKPIASWKDAMLWQEANPQVKPHASYHDLKLDAFRSIDPAFMRFLGRDRARAENMDIRLEEITWGGVRVDGIPSLDFPRLISADKANYLKDSDLVFGVSINGDARAYPLRIMGWHEMFNEVIGGVPVALAYCTLCGAGILFETTVEGRPEPLIFGSSGFLYRSNKLMYDRQTDSLWNQFTGEPVSGPLRGKGIKLKIRPVAITSWGEWKAENPGTKVLDVNTGYQRDYGSGVVYKEYFDSPELMFPTIVRDETVVKRKDYVFGIRDVAASKAWPIKAFGDYRVINDAVGGRKIVLIGSAKTRTVRAYERGSRTFMIGETAGELKDESGVWSINEDVLIGPGGEKLARIPGHIAYWFAWDGYLGVDSELYKVTDKQ